MPENVLVTGVLGFTGLHLARTFQAHGLTVHGLARSADRPDGSPGQPITHVADLRRPLELRSVIEEVKPDYVVHLAGISHVVHGDVEEQYLSNVVGTRNLLAEVAGASHAVRHVIVASSANVYGNQQSAILTEDLPLRPVSDYGVSKVATEYLATMFADRVPITVTRPFNYTGLGQSAAFIIPKIVEHFRARRPVIELGNIDVARDFSDVRDVCTIYHRLLDNRPAIGATLNICAGTAVSLREVIAMCEDITGHRMEVTVNPAFVRANEVRTLWGSTAKLDGVIGPLDRIPIRETLRWMLESQ